MQIVNLQKNSHKYRCLRNSAGIALITNALWWLLAMLGKSLVVELRVEEVCVWRTTPVTFSLIIISACNYACMQFYMHATIYAKNCICMK